MSEPIGTYRYKAYGLEISSPIPIPEFWPSDETAPVDVVFGFGSVAAHPNGNPLNERIVSVSENGACFFWRDVANILVTGRRTVIIDPLKNVSDSSLRAPLVGVVMGAILHYRNIFTLHASCVEYHGRAIAFLGEKGDGKSTMAAALIREGCQLVTDGILAFDMSMLSEGRAMVVPGSPRVKLPPDVVAGIGISDAELDGKELGTSKLALRNERSFCRSQTLLSEINILAFGPIISRSTLPGINSFLLLLRHSYATRALARAANTKVHFRSAKKLAESVSIKMLYRPKDLSATEELTSSVISTLHGENRLL